MSKDNPSNVTPNVPVGSATTAGPAVAVDSTNISNNGNNNQPQQQQEDITSQQETIGSTGMFVWSQNFQDLSGSPMVENYLVMQQEIIPETFPNDYCDFVFPIMIRVPENKPLDKEWISKVKTLFNPGCYLVCAKPKNSNPLRDDEQIPIIVYKTDTIKKLTRLDAELYLVMHAACKNDSNLNVSDFIDQIDDLEAVKGYFFPHRLSPNMASVLTLNPRSSKSSLQRIIEKMPQSAEEDNEVLRETRTRRVMRRLNDLLGLHHRVVNNEVDHLRKSFVTHRPEKDVSHYTERFNFFLSQDSFAVILDQNSQFNPNYLALPKGSIANPKCFIRLIRSNSYMAIEGIPRYCNLSDPTQTFHTRHTFRGRMTSYPMVIVQEGVKVFDAYYTNDGLDFTFFDIVPPNSLLKLDWYQLQIDLKMDLEPRAFKGHIIPFNDLNDLLNVPIAGVEFDPGLAAKIRIVNMDDVIQVDKKSEKCSELVFNIQQVMYTYFGPLRSQLQILWNAYFRIDDVHLTQEKRVETAGNPLYFYMKSFNCIYNWAQKDKDSLIKEDSVCEVTWSDFNISDIDLSKSGWSKQHFEQYLTIYLNRMFPYQNSIKKWLIEQTRKVKKQLLIRPTTLSDKLIYRNLFFDQKIQQFIKEQASKPRKSFLNMQPLPLMNNDNNNKNNLNKQDNSKQQNNNNQPKGTQPKKE